MQARRWLQKASSVAVLTGAGVSAESGIPTFRGNGGLWRQFRAEDLATPAAFTRDPKLVWEWYDWRRGMVSKAQPNPGHLTLATLEHAVPHFTLITQNVDDLHERAGSRNVLHVHGSIFEMRCTRCPRKTNDKRSPLPELPPRCECGALLRPGVVWFGEPLPGPTWEDVESAARSADVLLVIGTSGTVYPAAGLVGAAKSSGARVVEVNSAASALSDAADESLLGPSGELLPLLVA